MTDVRTSTEPLRRATDDAVWAGVAAGIARRVELSPGLVRLAFIISSFFGGIGLLAYVAGWVLIPADGEDRALLERWIRDGDQTNWTGVVLVAGGGMILLGSFTFLDGSAVLAVGLMVLGVLLYRGTFDDAPIAGDSDGRPAPPEGGIAFGDPVNQTDADGESPADGHDDGADAGAADAPDPGGAASHANPADSNVVDDEPEADASADDPGGAAAETGDGRDEEEEERILAAAGLIIPSSTAPPPPPTSTMSEPAAGPPRPPRRPRSYLGRVTVAAMLVAVGVLGIASNWIAGIEARHYLLVSLVVLGAGLITGAWWGRAKGLIVLGLFLATVLQVVVWASVPLGVAVGEARYAPSSAAELADEYRLTFGELTVDLRDLVLEGDHRVEISVFAGQAIIHPPNGMDVQIDAETHMGELLLFGSSDAGLEVSGTRSLAVDDSPGELTIVAEVGMGQLEVTRGFEGIEVTTTRIGR